MVYEVSSKVIVFSEIGVLIIGKGIFSGRNVEECEMV